jgi:hypothetical protein
MADTTVKVKEVFKLPAWVTVIIAVLSIVIGGAGWINSALVARQDANAVENTQKIRQLENEDAKQNELIVSNTSSISDIKGVDLVDIKKELSAIRSQTDQNGIYLLDLIRRLK